jgi:transcriptional regulator with XRE-family HTH domain
VVTRGERIRRARRIKGLSQQEVAEAVGISDRTVGRIELGQTADPITIDRVEAFLGLADETPTRTASPSLNKATDAELAFEVYRRLRNLAAEDVAEGPLPDDATVDPELILGPPDDQTRRQGESDG